MPSLLLSSLLFALMITCSAAFGIRSIRIRSKSNMTHLWLSMASSTASANRNTKRALISYADILLLEDGTLHPSDVISSPSNDTTTTTNVSIPFPSSLSPSAAAEFKACPQSYLFQYLYGIRPPTNLALAKGSMCHSALENLFDLEPSERTLENLQNQFRLVWSKERLQDTYRHLFEVKVPSVSSSSSGKDYIIKRDIEAERKWGLDSLKLLENYYQLEDPRLVPRPNPLEREIWVQAKLTIDPTKGATSPAAKHNSSKANDILETPPSSISNHTTFLVRGIVDRLDYVAIPPSPQDTFTNKHMDEGGKKESSPKAGVRIVDYKTGKAPEFKYSPLTNERIAHQNMWQLKIYALLMKEMIANGNTNSKNGNLQYLESKDVRLLRLMYLTSNDDGEARYLDMDLGESEEEQNLVLQEVHADLSAIWTGIRELVQTQDPRFFRHCDRKFCVCHTLRPKFIPGSLYQLEET